MIQKRKPAVHQDTGLFSYQQFNCSYAATIDFIPNNHTKYQNPTMNKAINNS